MTPTKVFYKRNQPILSAPTTERELYLIGTLARRFNNTVTYNEIIRHFWGNPASGEWNNIYSELAALEVIVSRSNGKVNKFSSEKLYIDHESGVGFSLQAWNLGV